MNTLPDIQNTPDTRQMPINEVGIKDLRFPIRLAGTPAVKHTIAHLNMTVALPQEQKGTHMSRFVALMEAYQGSIDLPALRGLVQEMLTQLQATSGKISVCFPFFRRKAAPVSGLTALMDYTTTLSCEINHGTPVYRVKIVIPMTSLCPCSKEISLYGAHNQRAHVTVDLICQDNLSLDDLIDAIERQASAPLYSLLKRPDEKFVTEQAYNNPKFVEDMVRDIALTIKQYPNIHRFEVESENFESIHNHSAYARIIYP